MYIRVIKYVLTRLEKACLPVVPSVGFGTVAVETQ